MCFLVGLYMYDWDCSNVDDNSNKAFVIHRFYRTAIRGVYMRVFMKIMLSRNTKIFFFFIFDNFFILLLKCIKTLLYYERSILGYLVFIVFIIYLQCIVTKWVATLN